MREPQKHNYTLCSKGICTCPCSKCEHCSDPKKRTPKRGMAGRRDTMMGKHKVHEKHASDTT